MKHALRNNLEPIEDVSTLQQRIRELEQSVVESRQTEEALRESEAKFRFLSENMVDVAFMVDMNLRTTYVSPSVERILGFTPEERKNQQVEEQLHPQSLQLISEALAEELGREKAGDADPDRSHTLLLNCYHKDGSIKTLETNLRGVRDSKGALTGFHGLSRDITESKNAEDDMMKTLESLRKALRATIQVMISTMEARDPSTAGHQSRSADLAQAIATEMGLSQDTIEGIAMAGSIHDIGKLSIPSEILSKPAKLSELEFFLVQEHPGTGYEILKDIEFSWPLAEIVFQHHERMDGSGYPRNMKGDDILMEARILAVADVVEAMSSHRPYRVAWSIEATLKEISENRGILYDTDVVDACLRLFREKGFQLEGT
ncbi:MAG: HD domain-containing phosphohydrolase [Syntrophales bacterium]|nr:HD domain-containing phosphohydrolase [Syntrophales bacterium]